MDGQIFLNAVGIHRGGGLNLLRDFARAASGRLAVAAVDRRLSTADRQLFAETVAVRYVEPRVIARVAASRALAKVVGRGDVLFSFASLPPLRRTAARSVVYVHAPHFAGLTKANEYPLAVAARHRFERAWFALARQNADEFWVQTDTMARALQTRLVGAKIRVLPFLSEEIHTLLGRQQARDAMPIARRYFYPADGVAHKNHANLLKAWEVLAVEGLCPPLDLTLTTDEFTVAVATAGVVPENLPHVVNLGRIDHSVVLAKFASGSSLVFPSHAETFGLPLLEATAAGAPLVVAERDYARDVCSADESFDPTSPRSIADAVRRHMGCPRRPSIPFDAAHIVAELLA